MEEYPNGRITEQGFIKIYTQFFTQSNDPSKFAAQVFRMFDENKVGIKLSFMLFYDLFLNHLVKMVSKYKICNAQDKAFNYLYSSFKSCEREIRFVKTNKRLDYPMRASKCAPRNE